MSTATKTKVEQSSERRDEILAIAARLISRRGYSATTVRDIAEEAGILSGSLYHHFASKEAMLQEILHGFMDRLLTRYDEIAANATDPRAGIDALIECAFETIDREPAAVGLYQNEAAFLSTQPGFEFLLAESTRIEKIWIAQLRAGQEAGVFRAEGDPAVTYRFIRDAVWATVQWYRPGGRHTVASMTEQFLKLLHDGLSTR
ncbi:MAG: TetR/AcrR family transcriptional regulator [Actinobacteria bacterium]|nr:TetR/AcrR family transcriptional regulator [Actinomycetota bacterium]